MAPSPASAKAVKSPKATNQSNGATPVKTTVQSSPLAKATTPTKVGIPIRASPSSNTTPVKPSLSTKGSPSVMGSSGASVHGGSPGTTSAEPYSGLNTPAPVYRQVLEEWEKRLNVYFDVVTGPILKPDALPYQGPVRLFAAGTQVEAFYNSLGKSVSMKTREEATKDGSTSCIIKFNVTVKAIKVPMHVQIWASKLDYHKSRREKIDAELRAILGLLIKPFNLKFNRKRLCLKLRSLVNPELYAGASLPLSTDMEKILDFLGMNVATYKDLANFKTWNDVMQYAITCRFYNPRSLQIQHDPDLDAEDHTLYSYWKYKFLPAQASKSDTKCGKDCSYEYADVLRSVMNTFAGVKA